MKIIKKDVEMLAEAYSSMCSGRMGRDEDAENFRDEKDNGEFRDRKGDYMDLYYNLKDYLDKFGRDLEKDYHYFTSNDAPGHSEAADLVNSVIDTIDDYNEQAQGEGTREEFVKLKDKVERYLRYLNNNYESYGSVAQNVVDGIIDDLNRELETY